ncbi:MAG: LAGLIDADG family homing endonuclease [Flavobacteriaceae bacterium]
MNKNYNCGSSETIRKAPFFNFDDFYKYGHASHVPRISETFLEWFVGFFEGDGSLGFSNKRYYNRLRNGQSSLEPVCERLFFSICQKERRIIEKIAYTFGFGTVSCLKKNGNNYWRWTLDSKKSIENISYLLSGNLILEQRQKQFLKFIEIGQQKNMFNFPFNKNKKWSSSISLTNGWLSGFIDAEGCFYADFSIPFILKKNINQLPPMKKNWSKENYQMFIQLSQYKFRLRQKFTLTQISTDETNKLFKKILFLFEGTSFYIFKNTKTKKLINNSYVHVEFSSLCSQKIIIDYLSNYPLQTIKNVSLKRWIRVYLRRKEGTHLSPKGITRLYRLVKAINTHSKTLYNQKYIKKRLKI